MINYKRIDNTIIVVLEGRILSRTIPSTQDGEDIYTSLLSNIETLNSTPNLKDEDYLTLKAEVIRLMIPPKQKIQLDIDFKDNPDAELQQISIANTDMDKAKRIGDISGEFEYDENGYVYLKGFSIPIPEKLADALLDAHYNAESKYTVNSLVNFWQWAVLNPNKQARVDLFGWFDTGEFVITEGGLVVAYRNVNIKTAGVSKELEDFVNEKWIQVKKNKQSPRKYAVIEDEGFYYCKFLKKNPDAVKNAGFLGLLSDLHADVNTRESSTIYTDNYTRKMKIKMGEEVSMPREDCDENHNASCSSGLHFMSPAYNLRCGKVTIVVLVNPFNIVAFPNYDNTKGRCCAYLPIGKAEKDEHNNIITLDGGSYDFEYAKYTSDMLHQMINESSFDHLIEKGLIASDLTETDFNIVKTQVVDIINKKIVDVE